MLLSHIIENGGEKKWCRLVKILEGRTENAIKNRFQLIFAKLRKKKENKSKAELELISEYVRENGGDTLPIKKQRDPAVNNQTPPPSIGQRSPPRPPLLAEPSLPLPIIPTVNFLSSRSLNSPSAFVPYLAEPHHLQLTEDLFGKMGSKAVVSMEDLPNSNSSDR